MFSSAKRHQDINLLKDDDFEFIYDRNAALLLRSPKGGQKILWAIVLFFVVLLVSSGFAELDQVTVGEGKVIPLHEVQRLQNLEGGIVSEIHVNQGAVVEKGEVLMRIDPTRFKASYNELRKKLLSVRAKRARLWAETQQQAFVAPEEVARDLPLIVAQELKLYQARIEEVKAKEEIIDFQITQVSQELLGLRSANVNLNGQLGLVQRELEMLQPLVATGAASEVDLLRLEQRKQTLQGEIGDVGHQIPKLEANLSELRSRSREMLLKFMNDALSEMNEVDAEISSLQESLIGLEDRVKRTTIFSPVDGIVNQVFVSTIGGVVQPGMNLVEVVPLDDSLIVEAKIRPSDIGFIRPGLNVTVKFAAYDFTVYGGLEASLEKISPDVVRDENGENFYMIRLRTDKSYLGSEEDPLPIIPGMPASVNILTGKKSVLEYLLKPVLRAKSNALRER